MVEKVIEYKNNTIGYTTYGTGEKYIVCFHGYGQAAYRWAILEPFLGTRFTMIAFDLPFHGRSAWGDPDTFTVSALIDILQKVLPQPHDKFYLLGYSMGGRIALRLLQQIPAQIARAVLLAPDGLHRNRWYRFATQTMVGRRLFYRCMKNPTLLFTIAKNLRKRGVINEAYFNMAAYFANDVEERLKLYRRWVSTRHFQPNLALIRQQIIKFHIPVELVFGKTDKIIVADRGIAFAKGLEKQAHIHILETGHHFLKESFAPFIASLFNEEK